jgi:hypothetical protein
VDVFNFGSPAWINESWMNSDAPKDQLLRIYINQPIIYGYGHLIGDFGEHEDLIKLKKSAPRLVYRLSRY